MAELSKTAALVMSWARPLYVDGRPGRYMDTLDLGAADELLEACDRVCPWYGEVMLNRKHLVRSWAEDWLSVEGNEQVLILAAGRAPLSLELLGSHPNARIVEVDIDGMAEKRRVYSELAPELINRIEFLERDIRSPDLLETVASMVRWFDPRRKTLLVMEGISYYLSREELGEIVSRLMSGRPATLILEYLVPSEDVEDARRFIPDGIFGAISEATSAASFARYSDADVRTLATETRGVVAADAPMSYMERLRTGRQEHFENERSGWIRCALIRF